MKKFAPVFLLILASCVPWNIAPECKFIAPENGSEYARGEPIEVYIEATDGGEIAEVRLYLDGIGITSMDVFPYIYTLETATLEVGNHSLKAEVSDNLGKEAETDVSFVITTGLPIVETLEPVLISHNSAIAGGNIIDDGAGTIAEAGILWSDRPYDVGGKQEQIVEVLDSIFSTTLSNLEYNTTYYVTAFAENEVGRSFGEEISFTVPALPVE